MMMMMMMIDILMFMPQALKTVRVVYRYLRVEGLWTINVKCGKRCRSARLTIQKQTAKVRNRKLVMRYEVSDELSER